MSHIAIVGATGLVGTCFLNLLEQSRIPITSLRLFASPKNKGKKITFKGRPVTLEVLEKGCFEKIDIAFFSAGGAISQVWAPQAEQEGCTVVDNSSVFRMKPHIPLVIPEVNSHVLNSKHKLISNPNCSTIQMCLALHPLHQAFEIQGVQVATYQSMSGAGSKQVQQLKEETQACLNEQSDARSFAFNCIPQIGPIKENGFSEEDIKMQDETRKILNIPSLDITAFTVRVPTIMSHGEVVWVHLKKPAKNRDELIQALAKQPGLKVMEKIEEYPDNKMTNHKNDVFVGRIHQASSHTWMMWVCADNIRKGAAWNGLQIAEHILKNQS